MADARTLAELAEEIERLKALLNEGHASLTKENEQLRWACASKDAENMMLRAALSANVVKGRLTHD